MVQLWDPALPCRRPGPELVQTITFRERDTRKKRDRAQKEDGGVDKVIRSIRYFRSSRRIRGKKRLKVIRKVRMNYAEYRRQGLPIGSGVVEAVCKTVIGHRFKRAGMRWSIAGGQRVLNLRVLVLSQRGEAFWSSHEETLDAARVAA